MPYANLSYRGSNPNKAHGKLVRRLDPTVEQIESLSPRPPLMFLLPLPPLPPARRRAAYEPRKRKEPSTTRTQTHSRITHHHIAVCFLICFPSDRQILASPRAAATALQTWRKRADKQTKTHTQRFARTKIWTADIASPRRKVAARARWRHCEAADSTRSRTRAPFRKPLSPKRTIVEPPRSRKRTHVQARLHNGTARPQREKKTRQTK